MDSHLAALKRLVFDRQGMAMPLDEKLALLQGSAQGREAIMVACGPSLSCHLQNRGEALKTAMQGRIVFAVKQAYRVTGDSTDVLFYNAGNHTEYAYGVPAPITMSCDRAADLQFEMEEPIPHNAVAVHHRFDDYLLCKSAKRPWGPSIVYELVFYMAVHMGVSSLVTVGWDIAEAESHFYDSGDSQVGCNWDVINRFDPLPDENAITCRGTLPWYQWLRKRGVELSIVSDRSSAHESVPRVHLESLFS